MIQYSKLYEEEDLKPLKSKISRTSYQAKKPNRETKP